MATTLEVALQEAASALSLLEASLRDSDLRRLLLASMGWALPTGATDIDLGGLDVGEVLDKLQTLVQSSDADRQDDVLMAQRVLDVAQAISRFVQAGKNAMAGFASLPSDYLAATQIDKQFITRLTGLVLARYLERRDYRSTRC